MCIFGVKKVMLWFGEDNGVDEEVCERVVVYVVGGKVDNVEGWEDGCFDWVNGEG